jgi:hypothetical protein
MIPRTPNLASYRVRLSPGSIRLRFWVKNIDLIDYLITYIAKVGKRVARIVDSFDTFSRDRSIARQAHLCFPGCVVRPLSFDLSGSRGLDPGPANPRTRMPEESRRVGYRMPVLSVARGKTVQLRDHFRPPLTQFGLKIGEVRENCCEEGFQG